MRSMHRCPPQPPRPGQEGLARRHRRSRALEPASGSVAATAQAQALCDLLVDPQSGITRVVVVGALPPLLAAVAAAAAESGVVATESRPDTPEHGRVTLRRPARPDGAAPAGMTG